MPVHFRHRLVCLIAPVLLTSAIGCGSDSDSTPPTDEDQTPPSAGTMTKPKSASIEFRDQVATNAEVPSGLDGLVFIDTNGERVQLKDYIGQKNILLVFTEGFSGMICPFCTTQTSRLIANYKRFQELETEVLIVYPGERDQLEEFVTAAKTTGKQQVEQVPFPILLDEKLEAVSFFEIRSQLAHPSTYIIDKRGQVKLAYVGEDMSPDRPSIRALIGILEGLEPETDSDASPNDGERTPK